MKILSMVFSLLVFLTSGEVYAFKSGGGKNIDRGIIVIEAEKFVKQEKSETRSWIKIRVTQPALRTMAFTLV